MQVTRHSLTPTGLVLASVAESMELCFFATVPWLIHLLRLSPMLERFKTAEMPSPGFWGLEVESRCLLGGLFLEVLDKGVKVGALCACPWGLFTIPCLPYLLIQSSHLCSVSGTPLCVYSPPLKTPGSSAHSPPVYPYLNWIASAVTKPCICTGCGQMFVLVIIPYLIQCSNCVGNILY